MEKLWLAVGFGALLMACGSPDGADVGYAGAGAAGASLGGAGGFGGVPQVNRTNCVTEIETTSTECDADHLMVMHCSVAVQPPNFSYCVEPKTAPYGTIWCCKPSFAEACGEQCR